MKRYEHELDHDGGTIVEDANGDYVLYSEHKKVLDAALEVQKILQRKIRDLEEERGVFFWNYD